MKRYGLAGFDYVEKVKPEAKIESSVTVEAVPEVTAEVSTEDSESKDVSGSATLTRTNVNKYKNNEYKKN